MWIEIVSGVGIGMWVSLAGFMLLMAYAKKNGLLPEQRHERMHEEVLGAVERLNSAEERLDVDSTAIDSLTQSRLEIERELNGFEARLRVIESVIDSPEETDEPVEEITSMTEPPSEEHRDIKEIFRAWARSFGQDPHEFERGFREWKEQTGRGEQ